ncbi:hypothetical protein X566_02260 [Afipia sp. P52-10]|jgi:hypothetical protein|uniref:hypothetical protein n=1 Tax=Afipia sp. P52-10 TaxID=1429916 RepID=UPI0003DF31F0|nr:hypothetical protein [Afipia sp. P52-10]ETR76590.1 hypothetical protein X566_02260 [Afipia sp. P52-10]
MGQALYRVLPVRKGEWGIDHDGKVTGSYATREAAFEAAVASASLAIHEGHRVEVIVDGQGDMISGSTATGPSGYDQ